MSKKYKQFLFSVILLCGCNETIPEEIAPDLVKNKTEKLLENDLSLTHIKSIIKEPQKHTLEVSEKANKCDWSNIYEYSVVLKCINIMNIDSAEKNSTQKNLKKISRFSVKDIPYGSIEEYRLNGVGFDEGRLILIALGKEDGLNIISNKNNTLTMDIDNVEIEHRSKKNKKGIIYSEKFELYYSGGVTTLSLDRVSDELVLKREYSAD